MPPDADTTDTDDTQDTDTQDQHDDAGSDAEKDPEDVSGLKSALTKQRDARKAAAARAKAAEDERDALRQEKAAREEAERKRKDKEAKEAGRFEDLANERERERDAAKSEAATLQAQLDQYKTALEAGLDDAWAALPETVRELWDGDDDDVLGRFAFMHKPAVKKLVKEFGDKAETARGNGRDPKPGGDAGPITADKLANEMRAARGLPVRR